MLLSSHGKILFLVLALTASGCGSVPPAIPMCLGDGMGGADCIEFDGSLSRRNERELQNYWMTDAESMNALVSWCYRTAPNQIFPIEKKSSKKPSK